MMVDPPKRTQVKESKQKEIAAAAKKSKGKIRENLSQRSEFTPSHCLTIYNNSNLNFPNGKNINIYKVLVKKIFSNRPAISNTRLLTSNQSLIILPNVYAKSQILSHTSQKAYFSTFTTLNKGMKGSEGITPKSDLCKQKVERRKKIKKKQACPKLPPCLKFVRPPGEMKVIDTKNLECGRICMPCCPQARYPPVCYFQSQKSKCVRKKNPRPSYSECPKDCIRSRSVCDCCSIKPPPCRLLPDVTDDCR